MLYLVGGAPRAGKTTIARKFLLEKGVSYLGLDYLKMGLARGLPEYGVDPHNDDLVTAKQLRPIVEGMARTYVENGVDYLLEGAYLLPEYVSGLCAELGDQVRACFIGYAQVDTIEKVRLMRTFAGEHRDWVSDDDTQAIKNVEHLKSFSEFIREGCRKHGLTYFESSDHLKTIDEAVRFLGE